MKRKDELICSLGLEPHPEGGFFKETHRDVSCVEPEKRPGITRPASTAIYYLLAGGDFSALHRIQSDEVWHFYEGHPLRVTTLSCDGELEHIVLGSDAARGQVYQAVVRAGLWFGARLLPDESFSEEAYALVGCTVAPGFEFEDFELAQAEALINRFPEHEDLIQSLRPDVCDVSR